MSKDFVPHQEALELKELGFDEPCFGYYEPNGELDYIENHILKDFPYLAKNSEWKDLVAAPTFSQAFRWFREKYNLFGQVNIHTYFIYNISNDGFEMIKQYDKLTNTYEEAELACLKKLIQIVKENKQ
jgi:hypothetical protein